MLYYNKEKLMNLLVQEQVTEWHRLGFMEREQASAILAASVPAYKRSHVLYRIGVFVLTTIILFSSVGFLGMILNLVDNESGLKIYLMLAAGVAFFMLHRFIKVKQHYKSGVDDGLLYNGLFLLITVVQLIVNHFNDDFMLVLVCTSLPFVIPAAILFADRLLAVMAFAGFTALVFLLTLKTGVLGQLLLPFVLMAASAAVFFVLRSMRDKPSLLIWKSCMEHVMACTLVVFYLAGNYFIVREGGAELMNMEVAPGSDIPFAFLFYLLTVVIPLLYVFLGMKYRSGMFLNIGLILIAAAVFTIRYYYSVLPLETALIIGGAVMLGVAWLALRYFKPVKHGITSNQESNTGDAGTLAAEALLIAQSFARQGQAQQQSGTQFGGGSFGGGGAGGDFSGR